MTDWRRLLLLYLTFLVGGAGVAAADAAATLLGLAVLLYFAFEIR